MKRYIRTYTGVDFDLVKLDPKAVRINDIAHALSLINRFNGHTPKPYSVAQHSVLCCDIAPDHLKFEALMHDAHEAYTGDMATPIKKIVPQYSGWEDEVAAVVRAKYGLAPEMPKAVKEIDRRMLATECKMLMGVDIGITPYSDVELFGWDHDLAAWAFVDCFIKFAPEEVVGS